MALVNVFKQANSIVLSSFITSFSINLTKKLCHAMIRGSNAVCSCHHSDVVIDGCWGFGDCKPGCRPPHCMCPCHFIFPWERFFDDSDEGEVWH